MSRLLVNHSPSCFGHTVRGGRRQRPSWPSVLRPGVVLLLCPWQVRMPPWRLAGRRWDACPGAWLVMGAEAVQVLSALVGWRLSANVFTMIHTAQRGLTLA
jgi:hypothetical protein